MSTKWHFKNNIKLIYLWNMHNDVSSWPLCFFAYLGAWPLRLWKYYIISAEPYWCTSSHQIEEKSMLIYVGLEKKEQVCILFICTLGNNLMNAFCSKVEHFPLVYFILTISLCNSGQAFRFYTHFPFLAKSNLESWCLWLFYM